MITKFFKRIFQIFTILIILLLATTFAIATFVDPNQFKEIIQRTTLERTGYTLLIQGPMSWRWFPTLSLELENVAVANLPPFKNELLVAKRVQLQSEVFALLMGKLFLHLTLQDLGLKNNAAASKVEPLPMALVTMSVRYQKPTLDIPSIKIKLKSGGIIDGNFKSNLPNDLQTLVLNGSFSGERVQVGALQIRDLRGDIKVKDSIVELSPIQIKIINSQQTATLQIDLRQKTPKYSLTQTGEDFEINDLFALFGKKDMLEGRTRLKTTLTSTGNTPDVLLRSLSGRAEFELSKGKIHGINLIALLQDAHAKIYNLVSALSNNQNADTEKAIQSEMEEWKSKASNTSFTSFDTMKGTATITGGMVHNPDLVVTHPLYSIQGTGNFNVIDKTIDYHLSVLQKAIASTEQTNEITKFLLESPLDIQIRGTFDDPIIRPDLKTYFKNALRFSRKVILKKVVTKTLTNTLNKLLVPPDQTNK